MSIPLPSLNLSFDKRSSSSLSNVSKNDNSNANNIVLNVIPYPTGYQSRVLTPRSRSVTPKKGGEEDVKWEEEIEEEIEEEEEKPSIVSPRKRAFSYSGDERDPRGSIRGDVGGKESYDSPDFPDVEKEFKDQLLCFTTDLLLKDFDMLKNVCERGSKVLFHEKQLKQLIAILYFKKEDRPRFDELVEIETERVVMSNCFCKDCYNPFYVRIKSIFCNKSVNFLSTAHAVNMTTVFKINLELCLRDIL
ncbi:hypothetical protein FACS189472_14460 [Alphaproteobacteria bacterium]|nr:hypothetical protein FACS189472_14460 [Alphaproteobacteria bacterium]